MKVALLFLALEAGSPDAVEASAKAAYADGHYTFCTEPSRPLGARQRGLCELAAEIPECAGLVAACHSTPAPKEESWLERLALWLGPIAQALLYVLFFAIAAVVAVPLVLALLRARRNRQIEARSVEPRRAVAIAPPATTPPADAAATLKLADQHQARGELAKALALYLAAALAALDRRGALRLGRHRTNGEYVRSCTEDASRPALREIAREVDLAQFGGTPPTPERVRALGTTARAIVGAAVLVFLCGCSAFERPTADPAGDDLPRRVLAQNGFEVGTLATSLATLPIADDAPIVVVDVEKVPLEDETRAHLVRWVEAGGALVLFGHPSAWPDQLHAADATAETRDLVALEVAGARVARRDALTAASEAEPIAWLGTATYAAKQRLGKGVVLEVANDDLFTNLGMMPERNAAALVVLLQSLSEAPTKRIQVARTGDGVPPPDNPFAALIAAGLGKGAWHLLAATLLLFLAYGIRHARPRTAPPETRRAFAEHIEATGAFYAQARAHSHARATYARFVTHRLREYAPRGTDPAAFLAARSNTDVTRVTQLLEGTSSERDLEALAELRTLLARALEER